jgi:hypothetical protein
MKTSISEAAFLEPLYKEYRGKGVDATLDQLLAET